MVAEEVAEIVAEEKGAYRPTTQRRLNISKDCKVVNHGPYLQSSVMPHMRNMGSTFCGAVTVFI